MHIKTGIDLVHIPTFSLTLTTPKVKERIFTTTELAHPDPTHLAGLFAAKEAFFKATQIAIKHWYQVEINHLDSGKPTIIFDPSIIHFQVTSLDCSISHHGDYSTAIVVLLHKKQGDI